LGGSERRIEEAMNADECSIRVTVESVSATVLKYRIADTTGIDRVGADNASLRSDNDEVHGDKQRISREIQSLPLERFPGEKAQLARE
jgi:hypothetical protein